MGADENAVPSYLAGHADLWRADPHEANLACWK